MKNNNTNSKSKKAMYKSKVAKRENLLNGIEEPKVKEKKSISFKKINKIKLILVILVIVAIMLYIGNSVFNLIKNPTDTVVVKNGKISKEETVPGYIIRDETVITGENYKNGMVQIKGEGDKVASGDPIFRYYSAGEDNLKQKIADLDVKIQHAMEENNEDLFSTDTKLLDSQIEEKLEQIDGTNDVSKIFEYKKNIAEYITKKAKIAGELSPSGSYLKKLIDERSSYERELNSGAEYINATRSGIVSYKVDGLEETLNSNDFSKINKEFLNKLNLKTGQIISTSGERGKIVNNFIGYIACISKTEEANNAKIGDNVKLGLPSSREVDAKIKYITKESDNESTIIFEITEGINELLAYRKVPIDIIWWDAEGYKVPNSSIISQNDLNYVIRTKSGYQEKVLVKLKKKGENYSVVTNYSTSEIEELDLPKEVYTSLILYDELLINPAK